MHSFHKPDPILARLLRPQKLREDAVYLLSPFTLLTEQDGVRYCYSTLTKQGVVLPGDFDPAGRWTPERIRKDPSLRDLLEGYFLKPLDRDETGLYESVSAMLRAFYGHKGLASFVILPTLGCNARCTYCYEEGVTPAAMSRETAAQVLDYLLRERRPDARLYLQWFGGEPLMGAETIDYLLAGLREAGVEYRCGMTTNGSLITPALADRMAGLWQMENVQITLDGAEEVYRRMKRYVRYDDTYHRVLENINLVAERGIRTNVRITLDGANGDQVPLVMADLAEAVKAKEKVSVYLAPLYELRMSERCLELWRQAEALTHYISDAGFRVQEMLGLDTRLCAFRCMASNPAANMMILPDGGLSCCQHQLNGQLGSVTEGVTDRALLRKYQNPGPVKAECRDCPFLPDCTAFSLCPVNDRDCREVHRMKAMPRLREMIRRDLEKRGEEGDEDREAFDELLYHTE